MSVIKTNDFLNDSNEVAHLENTVFSCVSNVKSKTLVQFETTNTAVVKTLEIEEHTLDHAACVINSCKVTWTQATVHFNKCFV
ncbi:hypothetical protein D3C87_1420060 [compost metagenome]